MRRDPPGPVIVEFTVEFTVEERLQKPPHLTARLLLLLRSSDEPTEDLHDHVLSSAGQRVPPRPVIENGNPSNRTPDSIQVPATRHPRHL